MLTFLRKHQRIFFVFISTMVVISFIFFGTFSTVMSGEKISDKVIGKAIDGSDVMEREVQAISRFLAFGEKSVMQKDFLSTGMAAILAERYFEELKPDFETRLERVKRFKPYSHPEAPFISAKEVWNRFVPELNLHMQELQNCSATPQSFNLLCKLYLDQSAFPSEILKRVLMYQQQQYQWVHPDPRLSEDRLSLFGFQSLEDWFGPRFMELASEFLINASLIAKEKSYNISNEEARADLLGEALRTLKTFSQKSDLTYADADEFLHHQFRVSGIDETTGVKIWKRVMLFRRLFDDVGHGVFLDPMTYEQFADYAGEQATVDLYQLPEALRFRNLRTLLEFQYYLDAVTPKHRNSLAKLPSQFSTPQEVEKRQPELVQSRFFLEVAKANKEEISLRITLKETWEWEASDKGWGLLLNEYPIIGKSGPQTKEERFKALNEVEPALRLKIDRFARGQIIESHPEWIEEALAKAPKEKIRVAIRSKGAVHPFNDIENTADLLAFLQASQLNEPKLFTSQRESFYQISVMEKPEQKEILTFAEALQEGILNGLLDKKLEEAYPGVRKKDTAAFQFEDGKWRPFADVKDQVGALVYADLIKSNRLVHHVEETQSRLFDDPSVLTPSGDPLKDQWILIKSTVELKRSDATAYSKEEMFSAPEGHWSSVYSPDSGDISFYRVVKREKSSDSIAEQIDQGQKILSMDARRHLMVQLLDRMHE